MSHAIPAFHIMVKPAGARCNLDCAYCFFLKKEALYPQSSFCMSDTVLDHYIRQIAAMGPVPHVTIAWQGGEPTLMGVDFYRRAIACQKKYSEPGVTIQHTLQTNGILLDETWCEFLRENNFLVGLSLDGPHAMHDAYRKDKAGNSVFDKVIRAVRLMQEYTVDFNILCTVNAYNSHYPKEVYRFFRDELQTPYIQFIPIVERDNQTGYQSGTKITDRSVTPYQYGKFLIEIFDTWIQSDVGTMFVQFFDGVLASYVHGISSLCVLQPQCGFGVALEHTGDVYSCDHYVEPHYLIGNIENSPLEKLILSEQQVVFGKRKSETLPNRCRECAFLFTCYGECPKNRIVDSKDGSGKVNWLCEGLKAFFEHTRQPLQLMAMLLRRGLPADTIMKLNRETYQTIEKDFTKPGKRNDLCPCGSGKKYKRCHGRLQRN